MFKTSLVKALLLFCVVLAGCSGGGDPSPAPSKEPTWSWLTPSPEGAALNGVWGVSPNTFIAVGGGGNIVRMTPIGMENMDSSVRTYLLGIWGTAENDVWAVGRDATILHYDGSAWRRAGPSVDPVADFYCVWGFSPKDIWIGSDEGALLHFDGVTWEAEHVDARAVVTALWGAPTGELFASTFDGKLWRRSQGGDWFLVADIQHEFVAFTSIWGTSATNVYVGSYDIQGMHGDSGLFHFDGTTLTRAGAGTALATEGIAMMGVSGSGANDVYAVGIDTTIWHWDGANWTKALGLGSGALFKVSIRSPGNGWAVGARGALYRLDGTAWTSRRSSAIQDFTSLWGPTPSDIFLASARDASGNVLFHWNGQALSPVKLPDPPPDLRALLMSGVPEGVAYAAAYALKTDSQGEVVEFGALFRFDGTTWARIVPEIPEHPTAIWAATGNTMFVGGKSGRVYQVTGSSLTELPPPSAYTVLSLHGTSPTDLWVTAADSLFHFDGVRWTDANIPILGAMKLYVVRAFAPNDVMVGGQDGLLYQFDGKVWAPLTTKAMTPLPDFGAIWGSSSADCYLATHEGDLWRRVGAQFTELGPFAVTYEDEAFSALQGFSDSSVYLTGWNGTFVRYGP